MENNPDLWLPRLQSASREPSEVLKNDSDKHTLKTWIKPWGEVCLQDMQWCGLKKCFSLFRRTSGRIAWNFALRAAELELPVIEQLLYLEIRRHGFVFHTYQVSRWLDGYNIGRMARDRIRGEEAGLTAILEKAAQIIARLHGAGFAHGDLKWTNLLYLPGSRHEVVLTDLDHARATNSPVVMGRDMARFILSVVEFGMPVEVEDRLIANYLEHFSGPADKVENSLLKQVARMRGKYQTRWLNSTASRPG